MLNEIEGDDRHPVKFLGIEDEYFMIDRWNLIKEKIIVTPDQF